MESEENKCHRDHCDLYLIEISPKIVKPLTPYEIHNNNIVPFFFHVLGGPFQDTIHETQDIVIIPFQNEDCKFLAHLSFSDHLSSVCPSVRLSVYFSHFHLLLQNHWVNFDQTWQKVSLGEEDFSLFKLRVTPFPKGR